MSSPTAKELLAQADRLMRQRSPEELPVLTDLVIEEIEPTGPSNRVGEGTPADARLLWTPAPISSPPAELFVGHAHPPAPAQAAIPTPQAPISQSAMTSLREQFNEQVLAKMEELQHSVFSQVMKKLEIHASGSLKTHLREALEPALMGLVRDCAEQLAEDTTKRVRQMISDAVDTEIAHLREQLEKKRF